MQCCTIAKEYKKSDLWQQTKIHCYWLVGKLNYDKKQEYLDKSKCDENCCDSRKM
jgi:hypothetical protein